MIVFPIINIVLFVLIGVLHVYWAMGGKKAGAAVVPQTDSQKPLFEPGPVATLIVAMGLFGFAGVHLMAIGDWAVEFDDYTNIGLVLIAAIFLLRFVGDFNYVGLFKKKKDSLFSKNDSKIYTPLCLVLFINTVITFFCSK